MSDADAAFDAWIEDPARETLAPLLPGEVDREIWLAGWEAGRGKPDRPAVYKLFCDEVDALVISGNDPAAKVVGDLTRAVKRAQMVHDGELDPVRGRERNAP